ncbi:MAG: hypothetical protein A4E53_00849 [Pelotomaculum sp. PtaB.Bin104]|nr:MAG: hypothetical protein A4E53_00849 [Pelotomaculum sp. PtaB.Bin104]
MNRVICGVIIGILITLTAVAFASERPIKIILDGRELTCETPPQIINDRTFVPIRVVSESLGLDVKWDSTTRSVILTSPDKMPVFSVVSYNKIDNEYGYAILGEVKNQSSKTFSNAEIKADILDSDGDIVETLTAAMPPGITPGENAYFKIKSSSDKGYLFNDVKFSFTTSDECSITPAEVTFNDVRLQRDQDYYSDFIYFSGEIERVYSGDNREFKHPVIQVALFDSNGKMVNYGERKLDNFTQNRYASFKVTLEKGSEHASYKLKLFSD